MKVIAAIIGILLSSYNANASEKCSVTKWIKTCHDVVGSLRVKRESDRAGNILLVEIEAPRKAEGAPFIAMVGMTMMALANNSSQKERADLLEGILTRARVDKYQPPISWRGFLWSSRADEATVLVTARKPN